MPSEMLEPSVIRGEERVPLLRQTEVDATEVYPVIQSIRAVSVQNIVIHALWLSFAVRTLWCVVCIIQEGLQTHIELRS